MRHAEPVDRSFQNLCPGGPVAEALQPCRQGDRAIRLASFCADRRASDVFIVSDQGSGPRRVNGDLVRRRLEFEQSRKTLERGRTELEELLGCLGRELEQNRARLEETRQRAELLMPDDSEASQWEEPKPPDVLVRELDVEVALLREKQRRGLP